MAGNQQYPYTTYCYEKARLVIEKCGATYNLYKKSATSGSNKKTIL